MLVQSRDTKIEISNEIGRERRFTDLQGLSTEFQKKNLTKVELTPTNKISDKTIFLYQNRELLKLPIKLNVILLVDYSQISLGLYFQIGEITIPVETNFTISLLKKCL